MFGNAVGDDSYDLVLFHNPVFVRFVIPAFYVYFDLFSGILQTYVLLQPYSIRRRRLIKIIIQNELENYLCDPLAFIIAIAQISAAIAVLNGLLVTWDELHVALRQSIHCPSGGGKNWTTMFIGLAMVETSGIYGHDFHYIAF